MIHLERRNSIDASPDAVWAVLGRYMHVDDFAPMVTAVEPLTSGADGVGSRRKCRFENGSYMVEEVTAWTHGEGFAIKAVEMPGMPLVKAIADVRITPEGGQSTVVWRFDYKVKYGPLGWLMGQLMMKPMMARIIDANLGGLAQVVASRQAA